MQKPTLAAIPELQPLVGLCSYFPKTVLQPVLPPLLNFIMKKATAQRLVTLLNSVVWLFHICFGSFFKSGKDICFQSFALL